MTQLASYLRETKKRQADLAEAMGITRGFMSEIVNGKKKPGRKLAGQIEALTGGLVKATSWDDTPPQEAAE